MELDVGELSDWKLNTYEHCAKFLKKKLDKWERRREDEGDKEN